MCHFKGGFKLINVIKKINKHLKTHSAAAAMIQSCVCEGVEDWQKKKKNVLALYLETKMELCFCCEIGSNPVCELKYVFCVSRQRYAHIK